MYECKSDMEIFTELAERLGISDFNPKTEDQWLREFVAASDIPDYDAFKKKGFYKFELGEPRVGLKDQIADPENHPFPTPSGKIEIYSETLATMDFKNSIFGSPIPPIPTYIAGPNSDGSREASFPLRLITPHFKYRTHTNFNNVEDLTRRYTHEVWINSRDAGDRNIRKGDDVAVFNDLGRIIIKAKPTDRIMPGVVAVYQGTAYNPDKDGVDRGGSANVLTRDEPSPAGAFPHNSSRVQISGL
jgi:anaerobic dimethyl sulfoxide reductase subunit A